MSTALSATAGLRAKNHDISAWFGALVVAALWMLARPYVGLRHDGILYAGQALQHLVPKAMSQDIFFVNGSQDSYSVISPLLAAMYARWGLDLVQIVLPAVCQAALLGAVLWLLRPLPAVERWLGLAAVAVLSHIYGGFGIFAFAERFVTGRTLAEPLALAALALLLHNRLAWALLAALAAAALHPLVTLPALLVGWLLLIQQDRRWAWAGSMALLPLLLAWLGRPPFNALLQTYDDDWWRMVTLANSQVLASRWGVVDWQVVMLDLGVLAGAARVLPRPLSRLAAAVAVATVALLLVSMIGADWWRNVLITQLQVWRVLWLARLLCLALLPAIALHLWRRGPSGRLAALALGATVVAVNGNWEGGWVFLLSTLAALVLMYFGKPLRPPLQRLAAAAMLLAIVGLSLAVAMRSIDALGLHRESFDLPTWLLVIFTMPAVSLPLAAALFAGYTRGQAPALAAVTVATFGVLLAGASWDRRSDWIRYVETGLQRVHPLDPLIPETAQVYWHNELPATWLMLRRPSYYSGGQGAGLLFNRLTALEFGRRHALLAPLDLQATLCNAMAMLNGGKNDPSDCMPTEELLERFCTATNGPDFMIFERRLPKGVVASWTFNPAADTARTFYLYDCRQFR